MSDTWTPFVNLRGERVALGPLRRELIPMYHQWSNDLETSRTLGLTWPSTLEQDTGRYEQRVGNPSEIWFTIYRTDEDRPIGLTWLFEIDHRHSRATFGIILGEGRDRGQGFGTEATRLMLDYAFNALGVNNVMLTVVAFNTAGIRSYEKAGFKTIGMRRKCSRFGGELFDLVYMECVSDEFVSPVLQTTRYDEHWNDTSR